MAGKKVLQGRGTVSRKSQSAPEPKRLSKAGEWMEKNPRGFMIIHDMKAVMR